MQQGLLLKFAFFSVTFVLAASIKPVAEAGFFVETELILDLSESSDDQQVNEWVIKTDPNHLLYFSFLTVDDTDAAQLIALSLNILDGTKLDSSSILFPSVNNKDESILSPFYSTGSTVSIRFVQPLPSSLDKLRLKVEKAVPCPLTLGVGSSCGRVVDDLSCYCALYVPLRTWAETKDFCQENNMTFVSIETYEEDSALFRRFGISEFLWIGASDTSNEGRFTWDSTGEKMSPGYMSWVPGRPISSCGNSFDDCVAYDTLILTLPAWVDNPCSYKYGGICELQPSASANTNLYSNH